MDKMVMFSVIALLFEQTIHLATTSFPFLGLPNLIMSVGETNRKELDAGFALLP
jgi:hypothetical protein